MEILILFRRRFSGLEILALFFLSCSLNLDKNCLNPKASCFVPDTEALTLASSTPADVATNVAPCTGNPCRGKIILVFSKPMEVISSQALTTEIYDGTTYVSATATGTTFTWSKTKYDNDTLTVNVSWYWFPENAQIRYTLAANGFKDIFGNTLSANIQSSFTTTSVTALFAVADTGQTQCISGTSGDATIATCPMPLLGQDGNSVDTPVARSFTGPTLSSTSDYTTKDNVTALVWKTCSEGQTYSGGTCTGSVTNTTWYAAVNQCAALNTAGYGGKTNWRLPTSLEAESILNLGASAPAVDAAYFPATASAKYWTSTSPAYNMNSYTDPANAWFVDFSDGASANDAKTMTYAVRCVSAPETTVTTRFTDNSDGTISDARTNLRWQKCYDGLTYSAGACSGTAVKPTWVNAIGYCGSLSLAGKTWRLPSKNELLTLVDRGRTEPAADTAVFALPAITSPYFWSSSTYIGNTINAWIVDFLIGRPTSINKAGALYTRCVTSGP